MPVIAENTTAGAYSTTAKARHRETRKATLVSVRVAGPKRRSSSSYAVRIGCCRYSGTNHTHRITIANGSAK